MAHFFKKRLKASKKTENINKNDLKWLTNDEKDPKDIESRLKGLIFKNNYVMNSFGKYKQSCKKHFRQL